MHKKLIDALELTSEGSHGHPGCQWDFAPQKFRQLEQMGLVSLWQPHNPAHRERAVITEKGQQVLREHS